jgi:hypothetical protein
MKNKRLNVVHVWKQLEDLLVPRLHLSVFERAVYSHLLRHSWLEGRPELRFSILWLARGACLSTWAARKTVRSLVAKGALRLAERSKAGHVVQVRLPEEIRSVRADKIAACADNRVSGVGRLPSAGNLEKADFLETRALLLLLAAVDADGAVPGPCGGACPGRAQWLPQPGVFAFGM